MCRRRLSCTCRSTCASACTIRHVWLVLRLISVCLSPSVDIDPAPVVRARPLFTSLVPLGSTRHLFPRESKAQSWRRAAKRCLYNEAYYAALVATCRCVHHSYLVGLVGAKLGRVSSVFRLFHQGLSDRSTIRLAAHLLPILVRICARVHRNLCSGKLLDRRRVHAPQPLHQARPCRTRHMSSHKPAHPART
jgi:hypothetical protein